MKKFAIVITVLILGLLVALSFSKLVHARFRAVEQLKEITISNTAWTAIPSTSTVESRRDAIWIDLDRSCTDQVLIVISTSPVVPGIAISSGMAYKESDPPWVLDIVGQDVFLWGIVDGGNGSESLYYQPFFR